MWKAAIASLTAGGALVVSAIGGALPVAAVHPPTLIAEYSCSAKHESFLANDNGSGEFARLGYGTLIIAGPDGVVPNDPADHHPFTWTWTQTNDYNALNIGKMKFLHADGLMLPAGLYTVSVPIVPNAANPGIVLVEMTTKPLVTGGTAANGYFAILSGPDQLPLTINLSTAKAIGLSIPRGMLERAESLVE